MTVDYNNPKELQLKKLDIQIEHLRKRLEILMKKRADIEEFSDNATRYVYG